MVRGLTWALLLPLGGGLAAAEFHVSRIGETPDFVTLSGPSPTTPPLRCEAALDHFMPALAFPASGRTRLQADPAEAGAPPRLVGDIVLPAEGRHLLLLSPAPRAGTRLTLLPADAASLPVGGVMFVNLTSRRLRTTIDADSVELAPAESRLMPTVAPGRRIVNHRLESQEKKAWTVLRSTTLILGAGRRCVFVLIEDRPGGQIRAELVTDYAPATNLAALPKPAEATPAPVTAEPPLPDPPAK